MESEDSEVLDTLVSVKEKGASEILMQAMEALCLNPKDLDLVLKVDSGSVVAKTTTCVVSLYLDKKMFNHVNRSCLMMDTRNCYHTGKSLTKDGRLRDSKISWSEKPGHTKYLNMLAAKWQKRSKEVHSREIDISRARKEISDVDLTIRMKQARRLSVITYRSLVDGSINLFINDPKKYQLERMGNGDLDLIPVTLVDTLDARPSKS